MRVKGRVLVGHLGLRGKGGRRLGLCVSGEGKGRKGWGDGGVERKGERDGEVEKEGGGDGQVKRKKGMGK